jgi:hypothetical protein
LIAFDRQPPRLATHYAGLLVVVAFVFGGGTEQGLWSDHLLYLLFAPVFGLAVARLPLSRFSHLTLAGFAALAVVVLWQFAPVANPAPAQVAPGGDGVIEAGRFWSVAVGRSMEAALFLASIAGFALFASSLNDQRQAALARYFLIGVALNLVVAVTQLSYDQVGATDGFLPFKTSFGFFANENHASAMAYCAVVLCGFQFLFINRRRGLYLASLVVIFIVLFAYYSRAGVIIGAALALPVLFLFSASTETPLLRRVAEAVLITIPLAFLFIGKNEGMDDQIRSELTANTLSMAWHYFPYGSGLGSFLNLYPAMTSPETTLSQVYVNAAHNDWAQLLLELGIAFPALLVLFAFAYIRNKPRGGFSIMGLLLVGALGLHSLVDYPLRTMAMALILAYAVAVLLSRPEQHGDHAQGQARHRRRSSRAAPAAGETVDTVRPPALNE